jgi:hypothetical protein
MQTYKYTEIDNHTVFWCGVTMISHSVMAFNSDYTYAINEFMATRSANMKRDRFYVFMRKFKANVFDSLLKINIVGNIKYPLINVLFGDML